MSKPTKKQAIAEMNQAISWFSLKKFEKTIEWLEFIRKNIEEGNPTDYDEDVRDVFSGYRQDYEQRNEYVQNCSKLIQAIYFGLLKEGNQIFRDTLEDTYQFIRNWRITQENFTNMAELTRGEGYSLRARYYLYCFSYLIAVEGSYSNWIKILYRIVCQIEGIPDDSITIEDWKPWKVEKKLLEIHPDFALLFEGYHGGQLRNAIGHGDFRFYDIEDKMHFHHIWNGKVKFNEKWTFNDFFDNLAKIVTVTDIGIEIVWLLRLLSYKHLMSKSR